MKKRKLFLDILNLVRYKNLLIIILTQLVCYYVLILHGHLEYHTYKIYFLILGTVFIAMAGYVINDYFDVESDMINRPDDVIVGKSISRISVLIIYFLLNIAALLVGAFTNILVWLTFSLSILALFFYSYTLKKTPLAGNLLVSALLSFTMLVLWFLQAGVDRVSFTFYISFAFLTGLLREIIKDAEDVEGDRLAGQLTFPVRFGLGMTEFLLFFILLIFSILLSVFGWSKFIEGKWWITVYLFVFVFLPAIYLFPKIFKAETKNEFMFLSRIVKLIMVAGILSMLLLLIN